MEPREGDASYYLRLECWNMDSLDVLEGGREVEEEVEHPVVDRSGSWFPGSDRDGVVAGRGWDRDVGVAFVPNSPPLRRHHHQEHERTRV